MFQPYRRAILRGVLVASLAAVVKDNLNSSKTTIQKGQKR
jgi:hypothetical protein